MKIYQFITVALAMIILISSCDKSSRQETEEKAEVVPEDIVELRTDQIELAQIQTGKIELRSMGSSLKVNGVVTTSPQNSATVCLPMGGYVKSTSLMAGSAVVKGQILAVLESQDFVDIEQSYLEARNKLEFAEADYNRHKELFNNDVYSQQNVQQVTVDYKSLKAMVKGLEQKLSMIGIDYEHLDENNISNSVAVVSPISGYIRTANINLGKYVAPSDVIFEIVNSDKLLLELTLFEKDAGQAVAGQHIRFFINNESEVHEAEIYQTSRSVNTDKTLKVYANVLGKCKNVMPGMYVNAVIQTSDNKVLAVPDESVVNFDDRDFIFVFERNKTEEGKAFTEYRMIPVQKGNSDGGYTEIILPDGTKKDDLKVVVKGAYNLLAAKKNAGEMAC